MMNKKRPKTLPANTPQQHWHAKDVFQPAQKLIKAFTHKDYSIGMHTHDFAELNIVLKGTGYHYMLNKSFKVKKGYVFVIPPDIKHGYISTDGLDVYHILINNSFISQYKLQLLELPGYLMLFTVEPFFRKSIGFRYTLQLPPESESLCIPILDRLSLLSQLNLNEPELELLTLALISHLCGLYNKQFNSMPPTNTKQTHIQAISNAIAYMGRHYAEKITLQELAMHTNLQREYFCRSFRQATGITAMDYLTNIRLMKAREMLLSSTNSISQIAVACGFFDAAHFSKKFKSFYGHSPSSARS